MCLLKVYPTIQNHCLAPSVNPEKQAVCVPDILKCDYTPPKYPRTYTKLNYTIVQMEHEVMYRHLQILLTLLSSNELDSWQTYLSSSSSDLNSLFEKSRLNLAQIFSAGFSSGLF